MCNIGDSESPSICNESYPKARKKHICCECGSLIAVGEKYQKITGLWDDFQTFKTCSFCADMREEARDSPYLNYDEGIPFGQLWECVSMDFASERY